MSPSPQAAAIGAAERQRLRCLHSLRILDSAPDPALDALAAGAAQLMRCDIGLVSLLDTDRQWFKARHGLTLAQTPRTWSFCEQVLEADGVVVVGDARDDPRLRDNPLVVGAPHVRFYAGAPLRVQGEVLGALCVLDSRPHKVDGTRCRSLAVLAQAASALLVGEQRWRAAEVEVARLGHLLSASADFVWEADAAMRLVWSAGDAVPPWVSDAPGAAGRHHALFDAQRLDPWGEVRVPATSLREDLAAGRAVHARRYALRGPDGPRPFVVSALPVTGPDGRQAGWRGRARDCLGEVQALRRLRAQDRRLDDLVRHVPGVLFDLAVEPGGRLWLRYANPAARAVWGLDPGPDPVDGEVLLQGVHPDDRPAVAFALQSSARTGMDCRVEYRRTGDFGACERWQELVATPTYEPGGAVVFRGWAHDIGLRRVAGRGTSAGAGRLRAAIRAAQVGVVQVTDDGDHVALDPVAAGHLGLPVRDVRLTRADWSDRIDAPTRAAADGLWARGGTTEGPVRLRFTVGGGRRTLALDLVSQPAGGRMGLLRRVDADD